MCGTKGGRISQQEVSNHSYNDLGPNKRQAIARIIDDISYWRIYASLGLKDLKRRFYEDNIIRNLPNSPPNFIHWTFAVTNLYEVTRFIIR